MNPHVHETLSEYLDGRLSSAERAKVETHLPGCAPCREHFEDLKKGRALLKNTSLLTPPESFYENVMRETRKRVAVPAKRWTWDWGISAKTLATACLLLVTVLVVRDRKSEVPQMADLMEVRPLQPPSGSDTALKEGQDAPARGKSVGHRIHAAREGETVVEEPVPPPAKKQSYLSERKDVIVEARDPAGVTSNAGFGYGPAPSEKDSPAQGDRKEADKAKAEAPVNFDQVRRNVNSKSAFPSATRAFTGSTDAYQKNVVAQAESSPFEELSLTDLPAARSAAADMKEPKWKGYSSGIRTPRQIVVRNAEEWQKLWTEHGRDSQPAVDFTRYHVVAVFAGEKPSAGYTVDITRLQFLADRVTVQYRETAPSGDMMAAAVMTQPYEMRLIPKTELPVRFVKTP